MCVGLLVALGAGGCGEDPDDFALAGDATYRLPPRGGVTEFTVDSVVYDPDVGGTRRDSSRSTWALTPLAGEPEGQVAFEVDVRQAGQPVGGYVWTWESRGRQSVNTLDGVSVIGLISPFARGTSWDPLAYADRDLVVDVAGEGVAAYKRWAGRIDSTGEYALPDGREVEAVWVTLSDDENLLELRDVREVYGAGEGLLERRVRILDTQDTDASVAWAERAERGFEITMKRM